MSRFLSLLTDYDAKIAGLFLAYGLILSVTGFVYSRWVAFVPEIWPCLWGEIVDPIWVMNKFSFTFLLISFWNSLSFSSIWAQAFKLIVSDPDSVLSSLTREVKETGPDGQEVGTFLS